MEPPLSALVPESAVHIPQVQVRAEQPVAALLPAEVLPVDVLQILPAYPRSQSRST